MENDNADAMPDGKTIEREARRHIDALAKPPGALGRLEDLAVRLCVASNSLKPETQPRTIVVFAADHGAVSAGVSLWPQTVSTAVAKTLLAGKGAASVMAASAGAAFELVDVGLAGAPMRARANLVTERVRPGTRNLAQEPALTREEFQEALAIGRAAARRVVDRGAQLLIAGEVGIGSTTAATALTAFLCGLPSDSLIGAGAGANPDSLAAKRAAIASGLARATRLDDPATQIAAICGLEIAAMAGFYLEAAALNRPVVLDGAIAGAAALIAQSIAPSCVDRMIAAHLSTEPAHTAALGKLGLVPFLDWGLRLGEGTGALALLPLIDMAAALMRDMVSLKEALALADV